MSSALRNAERGPTCEMGIEIVDREVLLPPAGLRLSSICPGGQPTELFHRRAPGAGACDEPNNDTPFSFG